NLIARLLQSSPPPPTHSPRHRLRQLNTHHHHHSSVLSSLLDRIESLESSFHSLSISSSSSLRDAAARVIQTHFRAFLVRRSRTLRNLKDLAAIKSSFLNLKSSVSDINSTRVNLVAVSDEAMDLLLQLDSIQNHDPMIRDGKRSISRDLDAFLECIDRLAVKRRQLLVVNSRKSVKVVANRSNKSKILREEKELVNKLKDRVEKIRQLSQVLGTQEEDVELEGFQNFSDDGEENDRTFARRIGPAPTAKKIVTFAENGNVYRVISTDSDESSSGDDGTGSSDDHGEISADDGKLKGSYVIVEEADMDNLASSPVSSDGGEPRSQGRDESKFSFSAPKPERMDSREDFPKKRNGALKIGT
ncbi:hypothetical protein CRG98_031734, partial [Punica granatum]